MTHELSKRLFYGILETSSGFKLVDARALDKDTAKRSFIGEDAEASKTNEKLVCIFETPLSVWDITPTTIGAYDGKINPIVDALNSQGALDYDFLQAQIVHSGLTGYFLSDQNKIIPSNYRKK